MGKESESTSNTVAEPWSGAQPFLKILLGGAEGAYEAGMFDVPSYPGTRVAPQSTMTQTARQGFYNTATGGNPGRRDSGCLLAVRQCRNGRQFRCGGYHCTQCCEGGCAYRVRRVEQGAGQVSLGHGPDVASLDIGGLSPCLKLASLSARAGSLSSSPAWRSEQTRQLARTPVQSCTSPRVLIRIFGSHSRSVPSFFAYLSSELRVYRCQRMSVGPTPPDALLLT